jgi:hypothetical protein
MRNEKEIITVYESIPGGKELLNWIGEVPSFHDGEIISLSLQRRASSFLRVKLYHCVEYSSDMSTKVFKKAVVTFELKGICYLELNGFSHQNVVDSLDITRNPKNPEVSPYSRSDWNRATALTD